MIWTVLSFAGCADRIDNPLCKGKSDTQCAWELAERASKPPGTSDPDDPSAPIESYTQTTQDEWDRATSLLGAAWTMMGEGVDRGAVAEVLRASCSEEPTTRKAERDSWTCPLLDAPALAGRDFLLEVGGDGVVALTGFNLGEGEAKNLLAEAAKRWNSLCGSTFAPYTPPEQGGEFRGCVLADGPLLVLSRFMPDPESPLWQVSLTVMPAG